MFVVNHHDYFPHMQNYGLASRCIVLHLRFALHGRGETVCPYNWGVFAAHCWLRASKYKPLKIFNNKDYIYLNIPILFCSKISPKWKLWSTKYCIFWKLLDSKKILWPAKIQGDNSCCPPNTMPLLLGTTESTELMLRFIKLSGSNNTNRTNNH